jgi:hypothetical protein
VPNVPLLRRRVSRVRAFAIACTVLWSCSAAAQDAPKHIPGGESVELRGEVVELGCWKFL